MVDGYDIDRMLGSRRSRPLSKADSYTVMRASRFKVKVGSYSKRKEALAEL